MTAITATSIGAAHARRDDRQLTPPPRGFDLLLVRAGRALERWGAHRARRSPGIAGATHAYAEARATAAAVAHAGLLPR
jgi:hypothetical protein